MAPPPRIAKEAGSRSGSVASRLVQMGTSFRPGIGGRKGSVPVAITTAWRALSIRSPTATVRGPVSRASPRISSTPSPAIALAALVSSRSRAIQRTRLEIFGKSTVHSTRLAARTRASPASASVSAERSSVLLGMQPQ